MDLKIEYTDKEITPWSWMILMKNLLDKTEIKKHLQSINLPQPGSNI